MDCYWGVIVVTNRQNLDIYEQPFVKIDNLLVEVYERISKDGIDKTINKKEVFFYENGIVEFSKDDKDGSSK